MSTDFSHKILYFNSGSSQIHFVYFARHVVNLEVENDKYVTHAIRLANELYRSGTPFTMKIQWLFCPSLYCSLCIMFLLAKVSAETMFPRKATACASILKRDIFLCGEELYLNFFF